jgi:hypothetical protein
VKPGPGILTYVPEFHVQVKLRGMRHVELISQSERQYPQENGDAGLLDDPSPP